MTAYDCAMRWKPRKRFSDLRKDRHAIPLVKTKGLQLILARLLEILGEATGSVSPESRAKYP